MYYYYPINSPHVLRRYPQLCKYNLRKSKNVFRLSISRTQKRANERINGNVLSFSIDAQTNSLKWTDLHGWCWLNAMKKTSPGPGFELGPIRVNIYITMNKCEPEQTELLTLTLKLFLRMQWLYASILWVAYIKGANIYSTSYKYNQK